MTHSRLFGLWTSLLLVAAFVPTGSAQEPDSAMGPADNTVVIPDAPQDVVLQIATKAGGPSQNGSSSGVNFDHIDITKVVFGEETEQAFKVSLFLRALTNSNPAGIPSRGVYFAYGKIDWRLMPGACGRQGQGGGGLTPQTNVGCISYLPGSSSQFRPLRTVPMEQKTDVNALVFTVDKKVIFNENRVPARFGDSLKKLYAATSHTYASVYWLPTGDPTGGVAAFDRAPNVGLFESDFTFGKGSNGRGYLGLGCLQPIRVSNGEATTIVYKVDLYNSHTEPLTVQLEAKGLPDDWSARVPSILRIDAESNVTFPVILSIPFTHLHGETFTFRISAQAVEHSGSQAEVDLGVFWTDIPQPAGHHDTSYFHSAPNDASMLPEAAQSVVPLMNTWFNPLSEDPDPDAQDANVPAFFNDYLGSLFRPGQTPAVPPLPPAFSASWLFPLGPQLQIGLDFDLSREGEIVFDIVSKVPSTSSSALVRLLYCDPSKGTGPAGNGSMNFCSSQAQLALAEVTIPGPALGPGATAHFAAPFKIKPEFELIPFQYGANIAISIVLRSDTPQNLLFTEPRPEFVTDKASIVIPLLEYHDPIDQAFERVGNLELVALDPFEKEVNPGKTTVFRFDLASRALEEDRVRVEIQGSNAQWAFLVGEPEFDLAPGANHSLTLAVVAPDDAVDGLRAELFLVAQSVNDPAVVAVVRLRASVTTQIELPDEAEFATLKDANVDAPGIGALVLLAALGGLVVLRRRRSA